MNGSDNALSGFYQACIEGRVPPDLNKLPPGSHPESPILKQMSIQGVPVTMMRSSKKEDIKH